MRLFKKLFMGFSVLMMISSLCLPAHAQVPKTTMVLVVDDDATTRKMVRNYLIQAGFKDQNIFDALTGSEALSKISTGTFNLVIADWAMEPMTGLDLYKSILANPQTKNMPYVMITSQSQSSPNAAKGTVAYLFRPFNATDLKKVVAAVLGPF